MDDQRPPSLRRQMHKRFLLAAAAIVLLSGGATATVALNTVSGIAAEVFPNTIPVPKGVVTPVYIGVVDALGCVYVNVDHRYIHLNAQGGEAYSEINLQPGYQKLCYRSALSYVRYRHTDSDFVRVARQQDFLRDLRAQVSAEDVLGQIDTVAKAVGRAITSTFHASAGQLIQLAKLITFSQGKPLRQVKFR